MVAPKGNNYGLKLKEPSVRQEAFIQYCQHQAEGKPKEAWYFEHPEFTCTFRTLEKYIKDNPQEFPPIQTEVARCKSYQKWFAKGERMVDGLQDKCQPAVYQMIMRNMFDWDKDNHGQKETSAPLIQRMAEKWRGKIEQ